MHLSAQKHLCHKSKKTFEKQTDDKFIIVVNTLEKSSNFNEKLAPRPLTSDIVTKAANALDDSNKKTIILLH